MMNHTIPDAERRDWAYLASLADTATPAATLTNLVATVGITEAADRVRREALDVRDTADADLATIDALGGRLITPADDEWPATLTAVPNAPLALWAHGPARLEDATTATAIIGTRASTAYGELVTTDLATGLAAAGHTVLSTASYGIASAAHRAALAAEATTVAVLPCGIDVTHPAGHHLLLGRIAQTGLLLSQTRPGARPVRSAFVARDRLTATLASAVVVVEAGLRSGVLAAVWAAQELGRPVGAVPGPVTSSASLGCHVLLRDGAHLIASADDVLHLTDPAPHAAA
ncbi:DNA-processing protein DprA [Mycobacterium sp. M1]|uniref:DNA-processing protein DprA n=1 Tax=Mycolicibacter acidiphilus TaxID=2835306 RepID=A0ABS5RMQ8_9MYCO|nr:DNA-processing protein DprA [Mycolicibacter acidiphilus]MBS9535582.1 DNA-processing protein DprA [Mycolicibacter acidiphilus]